MTETKKDIVLLTDHVNRDIDAAQDFDYAAGPIPTIEESCFQLHSLAAFMEPESHSDEDRAQVLRELQESCENGGFFLLKDHGVSSELIAKAHEVSEAFFRNAPKSEKMALSGEYYLGYTATESLSSYNCRDVAPPPDPVEKFSLFAEGPDRNLWPTYNAVEYKATMTEFYEATHKLGQFVETLTEEIMGVEKGTIKGMMPETMKSGVNRLHLYNEQKVVQEVLGGHTDLCTITLVTTTQPGYEVLVKDKWNPVPHLGSDVFVVNLGDVYKALTNGVFQSSIHRVNSATPGIRRSSINCFALTVAEFPGEPPIPLQTLAPYEGKGVQYTPLDFRHEIKRRFGLIKTDEAPEDDGSEKKE